MAYLKNKIITLLLLLLPLVSYGQWSYTFTDPCTLSQQTIQMNGSSIALNYFGNVQTFTQQDFTNGTFNAWMDLVSQANTGSPCESVTQVIMNTTNSIVVQNTITVVTNIMSILGGDMLPQAVSGGMVPVAEAIDNSAGEEDEEENGETNSNSTQSDKNNNNSSSNSTSSNTSNNTGDSGSNQSNQGQDNNSGNGSQQSAGEKTEESEEESAGAMSLANSVSNAVDGGDADNKNRGSLIASGDIVVIDNRDNSNDSRFWGSVNFDRLVGKAQIIFFSTEGGSKFYEIWKWPFDIQFKRLLKLIS